MKFSRTTNRQTNTDIWEDTEAHRQTDRQTHRQPGRHTDMLLVNWISANEILTLSSCCN